MPKSSGQVTAELKLLLQRTAKDEMPPQELYTKIAKLFDGISYDTLEKAIRDVATAFSASSGEGYLLGALTGAFGGQMREVFIRAQR
jgi:hypothetical protein